MKSFIRLTLIAIVFAPLPGRAEGTLDSIITPADTSRLAGLEITRDAALKTAREKGDAPT